MGPRTFHTIEYRSLQDATTDLRAGFVRAVVYVPADHSRRVYQQDRPRIAFVADNTDNFMTAGLLERMQQLVNDLNAPEVNSRLPRQIDLQVVEVYPYIEYIKYLLAGSIAMAIFVVA